MLLALSSWKSYKNRAAGRDLKLSSCRCERLIWGLCLPRARGLILLQLQVTESAVVCSKSLRIEPPLVSLWLEHPFMCVHMCAGHRLTLRVVLGCSPPLF